MKKYNDISERRNETMNKKDELLKQINDYKARSKELIDMFMAEDDIEKAKIYLEESKALAKTITELQNSYDRMVAREKQQKKPSFVNKLRDIVKGFR